MEDIFDSLLGLLFKTPAVSYFTNMNPAEQSLFSQRAWDYYLLSSTKSTESIHYNIDPHTAINNAQKKVKDAKDNLKKAYPKLTDQQFNLLNKKIEEYLEGSERKTRKKIANEADPKIPYRWYRQVVNDYIKAKAEEIHFTKLLKEQQTLNPDISTTNDEPTIINSSNNELNNFELEEESIISSEDHKNGPIASFATDANSNILPSIEQQKRTEPKQISKIANEDNSLNKIIEKAKMSAPPDKEIVKEIREKFEKIAAEPKNQEFIKSSREYSQECNMGGGVTIIETFKDESELEGNFLGEYNKNKGFISYRPTPPGSAVGKTYTLEIHRADVNGAFLDDAIDIVTVIFDDKGNPTYTPQLSIGTAGTYSRLGKEFDDQIHNPSREHQVSTTPNSVTSKMFDVSYNDGYKSNNTPYNKSNNMSNHI